MGDLTPPGDQWLTVGEVADQLELTRDRVRYAIRRGWVPTVFVGGKHLIRVADVAFPHHLLIPHGWAGDCTPRPRMEDVAIPEGLPTKNVVYFVQGGDGLTKIGTATDLVKRLRGLQSMSPVRLTLAHAIPHPLPSEGELHRHFARYRVYGEWFRLPENWKRQVEVKRLVWAAYRDYYDMREVERLERKARIDAAEAALFA